MKIFILLLAALHALTLYPEGPTDPDYWLTQSDPYLYEMAGWSPSYYQLSWSNFPAGGWTIVNPGGCTGNMGINYMYRGTHRIAYTTLHEYAHVHQGFGCLSSIGRVEHTAGMMAFEVLAEMCKNDVVGACYAFWWNMADRASRALFEQHEPRIDYMYYTGLLDAIYYNRYGVVQGAVLQKPLRLDDTWDLIYPMMAKMEAVRKRMK